MIEQNLLNANEYKTKVKITGTQINLPNSLFINFIWLLCKILQLILQFHLNFFLHFIRCFFHRLPTLDTIFDSYMSIQNLAAYKKALGCIQKKNLSIQKEKGHTIKSIKNSFLYSSSASRVFQVMSTCQMVDKYVEYFTRDT